ncbi:MAG: aldo/keto reductase [Patescibacteria group bacterium]
MALQRRLLGGTGLEVTELCFGALPMGPLQKGLSPDEGASLVAHALKSGINFIDTAQIYLTYGAVREGIRAARPSRPPVLATKSPASSHGEMEAAIEEALRELDVEAIDIFHLHAARAGVEVFAERAGALACLLEYKSRGLIRAVGISTHDARVTLAAAGRPEIDVVFPIYNRAGKGILNGTAEEMANAIRANLAAGKGVYLMKALGGGTLLDDIPGNLAFVRTSVQAHAVAVGMVHPAEVDYDVALFAGGDAGVKAPDIRQKKVKVVSSLCKGCHACLPACHSGAIAARPDGKAQIDTAACLCCGYCTAACPQFAIRVV